MSVNLIEMGKQAKQAAFVLSQLSQGKKNNALTLIADQLEQEQERILAANAQDIAAAKQNGLSDAIIDRLLLTPAIVIVIIINFLSI